MKIRKLIAFLLVLSLLSGLALTAFAADEIWRENPTGYTKASDVKYVTVSGKVCNWGVRGETASFLTTYANNYYTGSYSYATLSGKQGGTNTSNVTSSQLYTALKTMMNAKSTSTTSYAGTRDLYKYTDCMAGKYSYISSFYSGRKLSGEWDSGKTWNREHTWPNSKISGSGENDIMMLRPTSVKENSDRQNKAYGESANCYDPNVEATPNGFNVRGDCARIILYVYVRWGDTADVKNNMWGTSGVMESLDTLLKWMAEDPVDTWELGRNDAVQSITGVRNVFVDYPELAWKLFSQNVPANYPTPSGGSQQTVCEHNYVPTVTPPTCTEKGYTTYTCSKCGDSYKADYVDALGHDYQAVVTAPTCTEKGYTTYTCSKCGDTYTGNETAALGHDFVDGVCSRCGETDPDYKPDKPQPINNPFEDVSEDAYYFQPVMWAVENGVTGGTDETHFSPNKPCTRAQVVTFLYAAAGKPSLSSGGDNETDILTENPFVDVSGSAYYHDAVLWAFSKGITGGVDKTHFGPNKTCTRAQVVTFLYSWKNKPAYSATENPFDDVAKTAYYYDAVMWAVENGVTGGTGNRTFSPNKSCTRCQVVTFLYKAK